MAEQTNDMARQIEEAQAAAQLNKDAFAALSPELQMAARELGLFGQRVTDVADAAAEALASAAERANRVREAGFAADSLAAMAVNPSTFNANGLAVDQATIDYYGSRATVNADGSVTINDPTRQRVITYNLDGTTTNQFSTRPGQTVNDAGEVVSIDRAPDLSGATGNAVPTVETSRETIVTVEIDGEAVATATNRSESEGG